MKTIYEGSNITGSAHVSYAKYKNLKNIPHYHSDYELVYINKGSADVIINENFFNLNTGECAFIHSDTVHCINSDEDTVITVLKTERKYFKSIFASQTLAFPVIKNAEYMEAVFSDIGSELRSNILKGDIMADCKLAQFLITLFRNEPITERGIHLHGKNSAREIYDEISGKISNEYATVTFSEAARYMHFSEPYFSKVFHNIFGMTFTRYLNTVRIAAAVERVKDGKMSITEISSVCGFNTIRNFNRVFKGLTGYAPQNLPANYEYMYSLNDGYRLNPTLNCTVVLE
ncbi:MAG: helix-turn-helix domain-containing protein [Clostridia bacterium]|nr:helix-turn-helix domain-containing protein [Clostridia bacterium]